MSSSRLQKTCIIILFLVLLFLLVNEFVLKFVPKTEIAITTKGNTALILFGKEPPAQWERVGPDILRFNGAWKGNGESTRQLQSLLDKPVGTIRIVYSGGGETSEAIADSTLLLPYKPRIIVENYCASSCANYLLPIAREIDIHNGAVIAYHGNVCEVGPDSESCKIEKDYWSKLPNGKFNAELTTGLRKASLPGNAFAWMPTPDDFIKAKYPPIIYDWYPKPNSFVRDGIYSAPAN